MDDYDDWVERLDPHARQRFEWMNGRITELTDGRRTAEAERDAARLEVETFRTWAQKLLDVSEYVSTDREDACPRCSRR